MLLRSLILGASISVMSVSGSAQTWSLKVIAPAPPVQPYPGYGLQAGALNGVGEVVYWKATPHPWSTAEIWSPFGNSQLHVGAPFVAPSVFKYFDNGRAVGICHELPSGGSNGQGHPCAWNSHGQFRRLRKPPGAVSASAVDANSQGQIVGHTEYPNARPLLWQGDILIVLPLPNVPVHEGYAQAINDHGTIAGHVFNAAGSFEGAFWQGTSGPFMIGVLPGTQGSLLYDIGNDGSACGALLTANGMHAMRYVGGSIVDLGGIAGYPTSGLYRMNRHGVAIGFAVDAFAGKAAGVVTVGNGIELLDDHLDPVSGAGWSVVSAADINDAGEIVATAWTSPGAPLSIVLLTPMP